MPPKTPRAGTRSSSRLATKSSPESAQSASGKKSTQPENDGDSEKKRKADVADSPSNRPEKKAKADQKTLEQTLDNGAGASKAGDKQASDVAVDNQPKEEKPSIDEKSKDGDQKASTADGQSQKETTANGQTQPGDNTTGAVEKSSEREKAQPSNVLEKGIFYFFFRPRVGIEDPQSVQDIARSFLVLRPLPSGAKLGAGPIDDLKTNRLIALPKKALPKSHSDRFMAFVEKQGVSIEALKQEFMSSTTYQTQTMGERTSPVVTPAGEGVYAITTTGRESHLAYMLTIPSELGTVQKQLGLADKGSFILSTKNPTVKGPANAQFDKPAEFSKEIMDEFRGRSWMPLEPRHLDYEACQVLLIGEGQGSLGGAVQPQEQDQKDDEKMEPQEEMELLEHEDLKRAEALRGDDTVFDDLGVSKKDYPQVPTTW